MGEVKEKVAFKLPNTKITVKPIMRSRGWITDKNHEGFFLVGTSSNNIAAPMDENGNIKCPLTEDERAFFEDKSVSGMSYSVGDLSPHRETNNFWKKHKIRLYKENKVLDLSNPKDYITYKMLLANTEIVAPTPADSLKKKTYLYMLVAENQEIDTKLTERGKLQEAYKFFGKIEDNVEEMTSLLKIYGKRVPSDATKKWLMNEIGNLIDDSSKIDDLLEIIRDKDRGIRLLIIEGVDAGFIKKEGRKFFLKGGEPLALPGEVPLINNAVEFLKSPKNQDILLELKARLEKKSKD
jgi:hypothetical protein